MLEWRVGGIRCRMSLWFPAAIIALLTWDGSTLSVLCLLASFLHECGHFLAMMLAGDRPSRICFGVFGVRVERDRDSAVGYGKRAVVSVSGPLMNLLCGLVLFALVGLTEGALVHFVLAGFNLLPILSLDGGEAVYSLLCRRLPEQTAHGISLILSVLLLLPLAVLGFLLLFATGYNFSLLVLALYLITLLIFKEKH